MSLLQVKSLSHAFGKLQAISDFNLNLESSKIIGIIGPNGAGKTTLFNLLCGIYKPQQGEIHLNGTALTGLPSNAIAQLGISRTFQNIRLFKRLNVLDNVRAVIAHRYSLGTALIHRKPLRNAEREIKQQAEELLTRFQLENYANKIAAELPYGLQRRLEIVRALATKPKILLLDEPACGMNRTESTELQTFISELKMKHRLAILLIDHQMPFIMSLCPKIMVLNFGKIIAEGSPDYIRHHPEVIRSYLGEA